MDLASKMLLGCIGVVALSAAADNSNRPIKDKIINAAVNAIPDKVELNTGIIKEFLESYMTPQNNNMYEKKNI